MTSRAGGQAPPARLMVYGTDTGVGKTVVSAALAIAAMTAGRRVRVLKPVQTGAGADDDAALVDALVGSAVARTGRRLRLPLAPAVAARMARRRIDPSAIVAWVRTHSSSSGVTIVETAGGCAVEIDSGFDMADLGAALGYPGIVVCRSGLGTLNHTLLTVEHLRARRSAVVGLVVSAMPVNPAVAEKTNVAELARLTGLPVVAVLPRMRLGRRPSAALAAAAEALRPLVGA